MENVMIIFGGKSVEHDISVLTGVQIANACKGMNYNFYYVYIDKCNNWHLCKDLPQVVDFKKIVTSIENEGKDENKNQKVGSIKNKFIDVGWVAGKDELYYLTKFGRFKKLAKIDCVIMANHGASGEDGSLAGLFDISKVAYSSSGLISSACAIDKGVMKDIFVKNDIETVPYLKFKDKNIDYSEICEILGDKVVVKPATLGSSIGISACENEKEFWDAVNLAFMYDNSIIIEKKLVDFIEVNVSVRKTKKDEIVASNCEYPVGIDNILSFKDKYMRGGTKSIGVKGEKSYQEKHLLSEEIEEEIKALAKNIYEIFDADGIIRIDFMFDETSETVYANELNTIPGSLSMNLWLKSGVSYYSLFEDLINNAKRKYKIKNSKVQSFESSVLK